MPFLDLYGTFNSKSKVYPDGTSVAVYCNQSCFKIPEDKPKGRQSPKINIPPDIDYPSPPFYLLTAVETDYDCFCQCFDDLFTEIFWRIKADLLQRKSSKRVDSLRRSRDKLYDLVMCNDWQYFFTGTLGNTRFDPTSAQSALKPLQNWLANCVRRFGLKYVLVAEYQPKSGKIHFHGFINEALEVVDGGTKKYRGHKKPIRDKTAIKRGLDPADGDIVYNIPQWKFGFTNAVRIREGVHSCVQYIMKYITKDNKRIFGRYYWSSRNLLRSPDLYFDNVDYDSLRLRSYSIPKTKRELKYYTFFPNEDDFHYVDNPKNNRYDSLDGVFVSYVQAAANSAAILEEIQKFDDLHDLEDFEEV